MATQPWAPVRVALTLAFLAALAGAWFAPSPDVRILFAGTGHPDIYEAKPRVQTGIVVDVGGDRWLFDAGGGILARLFDHRRPPASITHIFVSHLHYDHCLDLDAILLSWRTGGPPPKPGAPPAPRALTIFGPDGLEKMLVDLFDAAYGVDGRGRALLKSPALKRMRNRDAGLYEGKGYKASFREVKHANMDCCGRSKGPPRGALVFSGDLGGPNHLRAEDNADFSDWAKDARMIIIDTLHLPPEELAKIAAAARPETLVLSHLAERELSIFRHYDLKKTVELCSKSVKRVLVAEWHMHQAVAPLLFDDEVPDPAQARRASIVAPAERSPAAQHKAATGRTGERLPVHSFRTLLEDLATLTLNRVRLGDQTMRKISQPTAVQERAFELLKTSPLL